MQWPNGNILVYLREPGQSSRGPAFRIHSSRLRSKGFTNLLDHCVQRQFVPTSTKCVVNNCSGCGTHPYARELYIPAPPQSALDATFDHHLTTRNFFAWIYGIPLVGQALGKSLTALKRRIDHYRPCADDQNKAEVIAFAESQKYLDFRECVDHALAALQVAEAFRIEDLWIDAFVHCVGLFHRGLRESIEYEVSAATLLLVSNTKYLQHVSGRSKLLINKARLDLDSRLDRAGNSVSNFFEDDLSADFLGLSPTARDHLDRFRSFLHSFYIEQHGFWPPEKFDQPIYQRLVCQSMYSDFKSLYHHLADTKSPEIGIDADLVTSGGVCTLQNVRAFDARHQHQPLPQSLPMFPSFDSVELGLKIRSQRRNSWNPIAKRKLDREERNARRMQALINSSNRDWSLMNCLLVRRYSEFEVESAVDDLEPITLTDGRKIRWIAVYAILQILISVVEAPKQVRNIEGLSYPLCCRAPDLMPWKIAPAKVAPVELKQGIVPDLAYSHTNTTSETLGRSISRNPTNASRNSSRERRQTLSVVPSHQLADRRPSTLRSRSLRRLVSRKSDSPPPEMPKMTKRASFCEIYVPGYGNGLNEVDIEVTTSPIEMILKTPFEIAKGKTEAEKDSEDREHVPKMPGSNSVSRESSNASSNSTRSTGSTQSAEDVPTPGEKTFNAFVMLKLDEDDGKKVGREHAGVSIRDQDVGLETVHFNTQTWDEMLRV